MVYVTYNSESGEKTVTDFGCEREGTCDMSSFDPCPLYIDLVENRGVRVK